MVNEFGSTQPVMQNRPPQYINPPSRGYVGLIIIGIIVLLVGGIIYASHGLLEPEYESDNEYYSSSSLTKDYQNTRRTIIALGNIIEYIGVIFLAIGLTMGPINDTSLHGNTKLGMLIAMGLIVAFKVGGFFTYITSVYG